MERPAPQNTGRVDHSHGPGRFCPLKQLRRSAPALLWLFMVQRSNRLSRLFGHWPELSERQRLALVVAVFVNGLVTMGLEVVSLAAVWRAGRRAWRVRGDGAAAVARASSVGAAGGLTLLSVGQKLAARIVFTSYERHLGRQDR